MANLYSNQQGCFKTVVTTLNITAWNEWKQDVLEKQHDCNVGHLRSPGQGQSHKVSYLPVIYKLFHSGRYKLQRQLGMKPDKVS